jgi:hypothetical protein
MGPEPGIRKLEKSLGLRFDHSISQCNKECRRIPVIRSLLKSIEDLKKSFPTLTEAQIARSEELDLEIGKMLIGIHGEKLWPIKGVDRSAWLVDATVDNLGGLYKKNLYWSDRHDRPE